MPRNESPTNETTCPVCHGDGAVYVPIPVVCDRCDGDGTIPPEEDDE